VSNLCEEWGIFDIESGDTYSSQLGFSELVGIIK